MERGGGVVVVSDGESAAGAGLVPLAAFLRAMFDMIVMERRREREDKGRRGRGERRGNWGKERCDWLGQSNQKP
jgi:hypothetical protein